LLAVFSIFIFINLSTSAEIFHPPGKQGTASYLNTDAGKASEKHNALKLIKYMKGEPDDYLNSDIISIGKTKASRVTA